MRPLGSVAATSVAAFSVTSCLSAFWLIRPGRN